MSLSTLPYWQALAQPAASVAETAREPVPPPTLPRRVDVLIVGAGYTGLSAARETAAAGAHTVVLDAGAIGAGCSGRNGGQVAFSIKPTFAALTARFGASRARAICAEGLAAVAYLRRLATEEGLDCDWRDNGCFVGAHTPRHFAAMVRGAEQQPQGLEQRISIVPKVRQREEIASDFYHGGCVYHDDASVDPMRMLLALRRRAAAAGATVVEHCRVRAVQPADRGFDVLTAHGTVHARKVMMATNGYTDAAAPWLRRRVIPIGSYQIATEALGVDAVRALMPHARNMVDSRRVVVYFRPSPDGQRVIFGGRAALSEKDPLACVPRLRQMLAQIFPQLEAVRIEHAWAGWVAYTFDTLPHLGQHRGVYYCLGYCGQGVPLAPYFGHHMGRWMMDAKQGRTALDGLAFPTRPFYSGAPWFLAPSVLAYRLLDAVGL